MIDTFKAEFIAGRCDAKQCEGGEMKYTFHPIERG